MLRGPQVGRVSPRARLLLLRRFMRYGARGGHTSTTRQVLTPAHGSMQRLCRFSVSLQVLGADNRPLFMFFTNLVFTHAIKATLDARSISHWTNVPNNQPKVLLYTYCIRRHCRILTLS